MDNIDCDEDEDANRYTHKYITIVNDKLYLINVVSDSIEKLVEDLDVDTSNDIAVEKLKEFKSSLAKSINKFNSYIKQDTKKKDTKKKDIEKKDTKNSIEYEANNNNNNKPDIKLATSDDIKAHIIDKQKLIKKRYKSLLETKKTIKDNIDSANNALKKLPNESQPKLIELIRLYTLLNDSINVIWRQIYERNKKVIKKIDINKIKNVDTFIHQLIITINNKKLLLKTLVIVKLNRIINDIKEKSKTDDVYNFNDRDKLLMICNDLDKYINHLKKDLRKIKQDLKAISGHQTESHTDLMKLLK